MSKFHSTSV